MMKKGKTLLESLYDNKPGPPPYPVMWRALYRGNATLITKVGPYQTWFEAREWARLEFTRILGRNIESGDIEVYYKHDTQ